MLEVAILNRAEHFQVTTESKSFGIGTNPNHNEIVIGDELVSDRQCLIEKVVGDSCQPMVAVTNFGGSMVVGESFRLHHSVRRELPLPCFLGAGETQIQICSSHQSTPLDQSIQQLSSVAIPNNLEHVSGSSLQEVAPSASTLSSWFESMGQLQRSTAGQSAFFKLAARCVYNPGGLDGCIILKKQNDTLSVVAQHIPYPNQGIAFRKDLVNRTLESGVAIYHDSALVDDSNAAGLHAVVVCPIIDAHDEVTGVVYGFRNHRSINQRQGIRQLEAKYVDLVADAISAGLIRLAHEADRARQRILLEQAFSPEVTEQLENNPDILNGRDREISVLFADLRGFCAISESIGATLTYQLLRDVMNRFTQIIHDHRGVIIDYYGDGLSAFWNAPVDQPDHAKLAVNSGLAIRNEMSGLNDVWSSEIGHRLRVGIGIHTGSAQVGNSGSQNRLKYGPQGSTVNIASRIEQSTKKMGINLIISGATASRVDGGFVAQRICNAKLSGIKSSTALYMPVESAEYSKFSDYFVNYNKALESVESGDLSEALEILTSMADTETTAQPILSFLLSEINRRLDERSDLTACEKETVQDHGVFAL